MTYLPFLPGTAQALPEPMPATGPEPEAFVAHMELAASSVPQGQTDQGDMPMPWSVQCTPSEEVKCPC